MDSEYCLSKSQIDSIDRFRDMKYLYKSTVSKYLKTKCYSREDEEKIYLLLKNLKGDNFIESE